MAKERRTIVTHEYVAAYEDSKLLWKVQNPAGYYALAQATLQQAGAKNPQSFMICPYGEILEGEDNIIRFQGAEACN